jgi:hypothetical protein
MTQQATTRKLELPLSALDDWDLLQAAFEAMIEAIGTRPGFNVNAILEKEFPAKQSKRAQKSRIKRLLSQRNEWAFNRPPMAEITPTEILEDALRRVTNELRLDPTKTIRALLRAYPEATMPPETPESPYRRRFTWTAHFYRDFFEFLAEKKIAGEILITPHSSEGPEQRLKPGEARALQALREASPQGLTVKELGPLTRKDAVSDDAPVGSLAPWLNRLKAKGLVQNKGKRPQKWFFVKNYEC